MLDLTAEQKMYYTLRLSMAMCFIGHGAFGIIGKSIWCNYFAVFGIGTDTAYHLMAPLGSIDILLGITILVYPIRGIALWLMIWGVVTALLRPLSGEPFAEFIERAGNYGAPMAMLVLTRIHIKSFRNLFQPIKANIPHDPKTLRHVTICLKTIVFLLLAGHGWLNVIEKKGLLDQYTSLGFTDPAKIAFTIGMLEIFAAFVILIRPGGYFLLIIFAWKMISELFYPHYAFFEWLERGGSYGSILALYFATTSLNSITYKIPRVNLSTPGH